MTLETYRRIRAMRRLSPAETQAQIEQACRRIERQRAWFALQFKPPPSAAILYDDEDDET